LHLSARELVVSPDDKDKVQIQQMDVRRLVGVFETCFTNYDLKVVHHLRADRFHPIVLGAQSLDVCTAISFIYAQR
jgi:hypothetical protein